MQGQGRFGAAGVAVTVAMIAALLLLPAQSPAEQGDLDRSFGHRGYTEVPGLNASIAIGARLDGSIVVAGTDVSGDARLVGLTPDGGVSDSFGSHGAVVPPFPREEIEDLVIAPNGNALLLTSGEDVAHIDRFTPGGAPDTTFGNGGTITVNQRLDGLELDPQRRLVTFGPSGVSRRLSTGAPDGSFGNGGGVALNVVAAVTDTRSRVLVADRIGSGSLRYFRLDANGVYDPSFPILPSTTYGLQRLTADGEDGAWATTRQCYPRGGCYTDLIHVLENGTYGPDFGDDFFPRGPVVTAAAGSVTAGGGARSSVPYALDTASFVHGLTPAEMDTAFGVEGHAYLYPAGKPAFGSAVALDASARTLIGTSRYKEIGDGVLVARLLGEGRGANADGDSVGDAKDRCPAIPGPRKGRGCRLIDERTISFSLEGIRAHGRINGPRACIEGVGVRMLRVQKHGPPKRIFAVETDLNGGWTSPLGLRSGRRYRVVTGRTYGHGSGLCPAAKSKTVKVP